MRNFIAIGALTLAGLIGIPSAANASDWSFKFNVNHGHFRVGFGKSRHHHKTNHHKIVRHRHTCVRAPIYAKVWVPPVYQTKVVGYQECGRPIYRRVCVRNGYHRKVVRGYRCGGCGKHY